MTVVAWKDVRVRVRIAAPSLRQVDDAFEEIRRDVARVANKKALTKRHSLEAHDTFSTLIVPLSPSYIHSEDG